MEKAKQLTGLTDAQIIESRKKHGANVLTPPEKEAWWKEFLLKFTDTVSLSVSDAGH